MPRVRRRTRPSAQASWSGSSPTTRPSPASSDSVYGIVRVAYDSYYTRLGVFPEAVGLSETTILGRAALYLALTVSVAAFFGGLWLLIVGWSLRGGAQSRRAQVLNPTRLFAAAAVLAATASVVLVAGGVLRSLLGSYHLAYYCVQRCKFAVLTPTSFQQVHDIVVAGKAEHSNYRSLSELARPQRSRWGSLRPT